MQTGDPKAALNDAQQALKLDPQLAAAQNLVATAHRELGDTAAAIAAYKAAVQLYINQQDKTSGERCLANIRQLQDVQAIANPGGVAASPSTPEGEDFFHRAMAKVKQLQYQSALEDFNWLIQTEPRNPKAYCQRGLVRAKLGNQKGAIEDLSQAMKLDGKNPELLLHRAMVRLAIGDAHGTIHDLDQLIAQQPAAAEPYIQRGHAYCKLNNYQLGIENYTHALEYDASDAEIYCARADARQELGNQTAALKDYQQATTLLLEQGNWPDYERILQKVRRLQTQMVQSPKLDFQDHGYPSQSPSQPAEVPSIRALEDQLRRLVGGNWALADRLLHISYQKYPDMTEDWHLRKVIFDLETDLQD